MRKLALFSFSFAVAVFLSRYFLPFDYLLIAGAAAAVCSLSGLLFGGIKRKRIITVFLSMAVGFFWFFTYTTIFAKPYWSYHDETRTLTATVTGYPTSREPRGYRVDAEIKLEKHPKTGIRFYYYNEIELKPGDIIEVTARLRRTDITDSGDRLDILSSRGIHLSGSISGNISIKEEHSGIRFIPKLTAEKFSKTVDEIFPDDISHFMQALLMGKRDDLYKDKALAAAFSASGVIHIISISGMHISFLMGFLALIIKNKKLFSFYGIPLLIFFMAMTGFTPAVTRAGIMQVFLITAPLIRRERDSITSLAAALLVLLAFNPFACASVGLHLSFFATLGIILFTKRINSAVSDSLRGNKYFRKKVPRFFIRFITSNLATTIGALIFTLPLTAIHFGYVSLIAPLTNLLAIGAVSLAFPLGLIAALLGLISPLLGIIAAFPVTLIARYIIFIARLFGSIPFSVVYSSNVYIMFWLAYVYIIFTALPILKSRLRQYIYPCCVSLILLFCIILLSVVTPVTASGSSIAVVDTGQGLSTVITADSHTIVVDCGSSNQINAGEILHEFLLNNGSTSIDLLIITHFHSDHVNGIEFLLSRVSLSTLIIPDPEGSFLAEDIIELARKRGTDIIYVTETYTITFDDISIFIYPPLGSGDENERGLSILTTGDITALITGDMNSSTERALLRFAAIPKLDLLVVGHHGSKNSTSEELLSAALPDIAVIPVGSNSFGHPSAEVLRRLEGSGALIYRTDEHGHVIICGGKKFG
ncbi:MAG: DNA internalization-related competence protein ComEC/Rec2 [Oscillospiraceae bacterium]|nr:DNA internalization-related competence protein ComEC/Rec2 [Oscillospiraceae bacterium]